jgi:Cu/Ag efflux protein CusF
MGSFAQVTMSTSKMDMPHQMTLAMTDGDVKKVDLSAGKITIKHGEIKNLEMPGMTMVFQVKEPAMLEKVKAGDKVRFTAEQLGSAIVVTNIQPGK